MWDPEGLDLQAAQGTAPGNHPHLGTGQPPPYRKLGPGPFIGKDGDLAVVSGKHIQTGHMVLVFMGQENPAEGFRLQAAGPESLDDPPTGNPRIDQYSGLSALDQGRIAPASAGQYRNSKIRQSHTNTVLYKNVGAILLPAIILIIIAKTRNEM